MRTVLALRHLAFEDLGLLEPLLRRRGATRILTHDAGVDDPATIDLDAIDLLVVLGGPIGAHDDALYPWLADEVQLIARRLASGRPLLGICLGAQLMARALGARVAPMAHGRKEIGFGPLALTAAGQASPLAALGDQPVLHWHGDQFALPTGCDSLANTALCPHQAFMPHPAALALQFHLEADPRRIEQWLVGHVDELAQAGIDIPALRADAARHGAGLSAALERVVGAWLEGR
ncbi:glutamine amidotransferase [Pseudorhodoferax aquiterrae]|uniref:glutamine amidotransferase n=1 Tax=Pseudorhodoferax aquiterrae TaxID=747304 RepID=UPI00167778AE|nr:glutamine amidotransferase [Pseudorhodoferax aquiterrae]